MNYLADTNILLRLVQPHVAHHAAAKAAVDKLLNRGDTVFITLQNVSEFWNVCTRPLENNGLGLSTTQTENEVSRIEHIFDLLPDTLDVYRNWRELVVAHAVIGVRVHDAKIVAAMKAHGIETLLTLNSKDFKRYTDIKAVGPKDV